MTNSSKRGSGTPATEDWVNEGGSLAPPARGAAARAGASAGPGQPRRKSIDTPELFRERAAANLVSAGTMRTENGRLRLEHSAAIWTVRADLLQHRNDSFNAKRSARTAR